MTLENLSSIFLLIFTQFRNSKKHVSSNQYMFLSTITNAITLFPNPIYTKASKLFPPEMASVSTPQGLSSYMEDTVQEHPNLIKPTCKLKLIWWEAYLKIHLVLYCVSLTLFRLALQSHNRVESLYIVYQFHSVITSHTFA